MRRARTAISTTAPPTGWPPAPCVPPKSNWARPLSQGPYEAYPIMAANVFTFGGLKTTPAAEVVDRDGFPIPGLWAAGEMTGLYYSNYTGSTSVLRGATFGRIAGRAAAELMRIWHQSFTVLDDVPHYRDALQRHLSAQAAPGTTVELHGMKPGTYPSDYPGTHIGYAYLAGLHREQFVEAALQAQDEGYDAFLIATIPDTGYEEVRTLVDIPVVAVGQTSVLVRGDAGRLGRDRQLHRRARAAAAPQPAQLPARRAGRPDRAGGRRVHRRDGGVRRPRAAARRVHRRRPAGDRRGANVIVPGEGPLNVFLADQGVSRVDDVPVLDSLGTCVRMAELRAAPVHRRPGCARPGRVLRRAAAAAAGRRGAGVLRRRRCRSLCGDDCDGDHRGGRRGRRRRRLRGDDRPARSQNPDLVVAVFEKSTREGCNAEISSGSLAAGGTRFQARPASRTPPSSTPRNPARPAGTEWPPVVQACAGWRPTTWSGSPTTSATRSRSARTCRVPGCRCPGCTPTSGGWAVPDSWGTCGPRSDERENVAFVDEAPAVDLLVEDGDRHRGRDRAERPHPAGPRAEPSSWRPDGFAGNPALMQGVLLRARANPSTAGDKHQHRGRHRLADRLGAGFRNMGACLRHGLVVVGHGTRVTPALPFYGAVLVNTEGRRFIDEQSAGLFVAWQVCCRNSPASVPRWCGTGRRWRSPRSRR